MEADNYKTEINAILKQLNDQLQDCEVGSNARREAKERIAEFEFVIKNRDIIAFREFTTMNLSFPICMQPIFEKHFDNIRSYCKNQKLRTPKIVQSKFKFGHWRLYFDSKEQHLPTMFYVLVDNLCAELEQKILYKPK